MYEKTFLSVEKKTTRDDDEEEEEDGRENDALKSGRDRGESDHAFDSVENENDDRKQRRLKKNTHFRLHEGCGQTDLKIAASKRSLMTSTSVAPWPSTLAPHPSRPLVAKV